MNYLRRFIQNILGSSGKIFSRGKESMVSDEHEFFTEIGKFKLLINPDHDLPFCLKQYPFYGTNLPRIAEVIKQKYPELIAIDIGANVGDTVALLRSREFFPIVCIEGNEKFYSFLLKNLEKFPETYPYKFFLSDKNIETSVSTLYQKGTFQIRTLTKENENIEKLKFTTLDLFIQKNTQFEKAKLLKIDTDGFDLHVLKGGFQFIQKAKPIIFFEFDEVYFRLNGQVNYEWRKSLIEFGYNKIIFYDNFGHFLLSTELENEKLIEQLILYISKRDGAFNFYDLCVFHGEDDAMASEIIQTEMEFFTT